MGQWRAGEAPRACRGCGYLYPSVLPVPTQPSATPSHPTQLHASADATRESAKCSPNAHACAACSWEARALPLGVHAPPLTVDHDNILWIRWARLRKRRRRVCNSPQWWVGIHAHAATCHAGLRALGAGSAGSDEGWTTPQGQCLCTSFSLPARCMSCIHMYRHAGRRSIINHNSWTTPPCAACVPVGWPTQHEMSMACSSQQ